MECNRRLEYLKKPLKQNTYIAKKTNKKMKDGY